MANPSSIGVDDRNPAVIEVTDTEASVTLDPNLEYELTHLSVDNGGSAETANAYFRMDADTVVTTVAEGANKLVLKSGASHIIGAGYNTLYFATNASGEEPVVQVIPRENRFGQY